MGLDIFICTDKNITKSGIPNSLSRIFLRLILRQHDNNDEEISQIAKISGVDLNPLFEMEIPDTGFLEFQMDFIEDEKEVQKIKEEIAHTKESYSKDIQPIIDTLQKLNTALVNNPNYYTELRLTEPDEAYINYFKNYSIDVKPNEYGSISSGEINFGIDIRSLLNYLIVSKDQGAKKAYFNFS